MAVTFTNKHNLPQEFVDAMMLDNHVVNGDISVTTLIDAPQIRQLKKSGDYEIDLSDMMAMFFGTAIHERLESSNPVMHQGKILSLAASVIGADEGNEGHQKVSKWIKGFQKKLIKSSPQNVLIEQTLTIDVEGWTLSGTLDRYFKDTKTIRDYKTTTASQLMQPDQKDSWYLQQNIYACMLRASGYEVENIEICAIVKDWSKMKINTSRDYPKSPFVTVKIKIAENEDVLKYIATRIALHKRADEGEQFPCTKKERWAKEDVFAVRKKGGKKSLKNLSSKKIAEGHLGAISHKYPADSLYIEHRPAQSFRCKNYCSMNSICPQYQKELETQAKQGEETF